MVAKKNELKLIMAILMLLMLLMTISANHVEVCPNQQVIAGEFVELIQFVHVDEVDDCL